MASGVGNGFVVKGRRRVTCEPFTAWQSLLARQYQKGISSPTRVVLE